MMTMLEGLSIKYWVVFQLAVDLVLVLMILYFIRNLRSGDLSKEAVKRVIGMLEPVLKEADMTAKTFESQLKEKHRLIDRLNERLDSRIISLNLLMNRSEAHLSAGPAAGQSRQDVYDQQKAILDLFARGHDAEAVARKLSLPKREVEMVFELKRKFMKMEAVE